MNPIVRRKLAAWNRQASQKRAYRREYVSAIGRASAIRAEEINARLDAQRDYARELNQLQAMRSEGILNTGAYEQKRSEALQRLKSRVALNHSVTLALLNMLCG